VNSQYPPQSPYETYDAPVQRRRFDNWTIAVIAAAGIAGCMCLAAIGVLCLFVTLGPVPTPATPRPVINSATIGANNGVAVPTVQPTLDPASVGKAINPAVSADLDGMTVLQIDILDQATGNYTRAAQLTGSDLDIFAESLNISVQTTAPNTDCPDHVRFSITRQDSSVVTIGVCLKQVVILRGLPDLGGADAPMGPRFTDALERYLPDNYKSLLNF
jgi:hypothetical protein